MTTLERAAQEGDIDRLYEVIACNPCVLEDMDSIQFVETPLHIAASFGHLQFAAEIMDLKPSFALKRNLQGFTPIHLALLNNNKRVALRLVEINKDLVRAKMRRGVTALHVATQSGDIDLLTTFLKECPDSIKDVTIASETALHLALKYHQFGALKFLVKWLNTKTMEFERTILNRKDEDGNTILHVAALNNSAENATGSDTEAMEWLIKHTQWTIDVDAKNLIGQKAIDAAAGRVGACTKSELVKARAINTITRKIDSLFLFMNSRLFRQSRVAGPMTEENRNAYLVVATLVATATYQSILSPPPGLHQSQSYVPTNNNTSLTHLPSSNSTLLEEGKSVLLNYHFLFYSTTTLCAFLVSIFTIICLMPRNAAWLPLYSATVLLVCSYFFSMKVISPISITFSVIFLVIVAIFTRISN